MHPYILERLAKDRLEVEDLAEEERVAGCVVAQRTAPLLNSPAARARPFDADSRTRPMEQLPARMPLGVQ